MIDESTASRSASMFGRLGFLNAGLTGNAAVQLYPAPRPASSADVPAVGMLVSVPLADPAGTVVGATLVLASLEPGLVAETGVPVWARVVNRDGATAFDMDAGVAGSMPGGADPECVLAQATVYAGGRVEILSAVLG